MAPTTTTIELPTPLYRLERVHGQVRALCRAGRGPWLSMGQDMLKPDLPMQVGLFASGQIERVFYPGAYVEGTAIGFTG